MKLRLIIESMAAGLLLWLIFSVLGGMLLTILSVPEITEGYTGSVNVESRVEFGRKPGWWMNVLQWVAASAIYLLFRLGIRAVWSRRRGA
ncbi:hypothetical protein [Paenibacillus herberti]|uniref:Uncharacterized protein n=1 Tax=Paenibacillus herberti TaxID=1619309 RepID=A0A229NV34_9BACL|nr:hypothetical protein [Paenibacillus herberti]OXM13595.1 hypothetical protein CGZ75_21445 [Paenibacillus herberti]